MTHTKNRKRRERSFIRVERIYPALIEGRMARGHRSLDGPEPWRPKLHGWREIGYVTRAQTPWSAPTHDVLGDVERAVKLYAENTGYTVTPEQERFLHYYYKWPRQSGKTMARETLQLPSGALYIAPLGTPPPGRTGRAE